MVNTTETNNWGRERALVLEEIKRLRENHEKVENKIEVLLDRLHKDTTSIRVEVAKLQVKAGIWGALAGVITALVAVLMNKIGS